MMCYKNSEKFRRPLESFCIIGRSFPVKRTHTRVVFLYVPGISMFRDTSLTLDIEYLLYFILTFLSVCVIIGIYRK